ncbi:MAG TPA: GNAT family N-acetyltransferase [Planctomycetota bacterium]|nr:GNAT family N-acetyltransferase [Planctomycetota bacterium]
MDDALKSHPAPAPGGRSPGGGAAAASSGKPLAGLRTSIVADDAGFAALRRRWDALLAQAVDANTFLGFEWLHSWWVSYQVPAELRLVLAEDGDQLVGIAPMMLRTVRRYGKAFRVLLFVGDGTWETDHMNLILRRDRRAEALAALLATLETLAWDAVHFNQVPESSETARDLLTWAKSKGMAVDVVRTPCPKRNIPESYDALLATLQSRFRTSLRSSRRKLGQKYRLEFGLHENPAEFPEALEALFRNHASRWKAKGQGGVFTDPRKRAFYDMLVRELHGKGALRFYYLKLDGAIKAQEFCFAHGRVVYLLQEGFDYDHAAENIGNTLRGMVLERLIAEKAEAYDFLAGTSRHKSLWGDAFPNDMRIEAARPTLKGRLYFHVPKRIEALKEAVKKAIRKAPAAAPSAAGANPDSP